MRSYFGGTQADAVFARYQFGNRTLLALATGATLTFWSAAQGGTRYTDLLDENGDPASSITFIGHQMPRIQGPDGVLAMWVDDGDNDRHLLYAVDVESVAAARDRAEQAASDAEGAITNVEQLVETKVGEALADFDPTPVDPNIILWNPSTRQYQARHPAAVPYGVEAVTTNDPTAPAPHTQPQTGFVSGDRWEWHPDGGPA